MAVLTWSASASPSVVGYRVYHGPAPGSYLQARGRGLRAGLDGTFTVAGLPSGQRHYFAVSSVDATGNESPLSTEVSKLIP